MRLFLSSLILGVLLHGVSGHHDHIGSWPFTVHYHEHGIYRAFFGGFFTTLFLIFGALVLYFYCLRGQSLRTLLPTFPKKLAVPITVPFVSSRLPNFIEADQPETIVLTTTRTAPPTAFYSNAPPSFQSSSSPWRDQTSATYTKSGYPGYNVV